MKAQSVFLVCLLFSNLLLAQEPPLRVLVIAGQDQIHNVNGKVHTELVVEVQDQDRKPVNDAAVVFTLPPQGPGGTFDNGTTTLTATTDKQGRVFVHGYRLNKQLGVFSIRVTASAEGKTANTTISQTSVSGVPATSGTLGVSTKAWVILGVCVIGIAGAVIAAHNLAGGSNPNNLTITPGTPVVGGPTPAVGAIR